MSNIFCDQTFSDDGRTYRVQASRNHYERDVYTLCVSTGSTSVTTSLSVRLNLETLENAIRYTVNTKMPYSLRDPDSTSMVALALHYAIGYAERVSCECGAEKCKTTHALWCPALPAKKAS